MSYRDWLHNPPVGVGFLVVVSLALLTLHNHQREAAGGNDTATQEYRQTNPVIAPGQFTQSKAATDEPANEKERANRDLKAQEGMAKWAFWLLIVSGAGVVLLGATLRETYKAGQSAAEILAQTKRQADLAEQSFKRLERPYLFLSIVETRHLANPPINGKPYLTCALVNHGKTPAVFKSLFLELLPFSHLIFTDDGTPRIPVSAPRKHWYEVLRQGGETGLISVDVAGTRDAERVPPSASLYLHGMVEYEDPSRALHSHHFVLTRQNGSFRLEYSRNHSHYPEEE